MARVAPRLPLVLLLCPLLLAPACSGTIQSVNEKASSDDLLAGGNKSSGAAQRPPTTDLVVPSHYLVVAYNQAQEGRDRAEQELQAKHVEAAGAELKRVIKLTSDTLDRVDREKLAGSWQTGLKYPTERDAILTEPEILTRMAEIRDSARKSWTETAWPAIRAMLRKKFHAVSQEQTALLEEMGSPKETFMMKGSRCWVFDTENQYVTYCFDSRGEQVRRSVRDKQEP